MDIPTFVFFLVSLCSGTAYLIFMYAVVQYLPHKKWLPRFIALLCLAFAVILVRRYGFWQHDMLGTDIAVIMGFIAALWGVVVRAAVERIKPRRRRQRPILIGAFFVVPVLVFIYLQHVFANLYEAISLDQI